MNPPLSDVILFRYRCS